MTRSDSAPPTRISSAARAESEPAISAAPATSTRRTASTRAMVSRRRELTLRSYVQSGPASSQLTCKRGGGGLLHSS
eukprot:scaffold30529_cov70-Isochrysis_galbana.AAC.2